MARTDVDGEARVMIPPDPVEAGGFIPHDPVLAGLEPYETLSADPVIATEQATRITLIPIVDPDAPPPEPEPEPEPDPEPEAAAATKKSSKRKFDTKKVG
jgi:hypothetical protein